MKSLIFFLLELLSLHVCLIEQEIMVLSCSKEGSGWILGKFLKRSINALAQTAQGVIVLGDVQDPQRCGTGGRCQRAW